jgi:hypothetical protein
LARLVDPLAGDGTTAGRRRLGPAILKEASMPTRSKGRRWSAKVTETSNAMDLEPKVFEQEDPKRIAASLKHSAEQSKRRKASPFQSAMSMLTFYMNRAGKALPAERKETLQKAKDELRKDFGRD